MMTSRERVRLALDHQEADRVPFDPGGAGLTSIHVDAFRSLRAHLGLPPAGARILAMAEQLAIVDEDVAQRLDADARLVLPVHDIQANVPPENLVSMWEAWREFGSY